MKKTFVDRAKDIHGDKFDYSSVVYVNARMPVTVSCNACGKDWRVSPYSHAKINGTGSGCPHCAGFNRTTKDFIEAARRVHGDKYDLSFVEYKRAKQPVSVRCPIHDRFWCTTWQTFIVAGHGCQLCGASRRSPQVSEISSRFRKVHGDKYDYSRFVEWHGWHKKIEVICSVHDQHSFFPTPASHYFGKLDVTYVGTWRSLHLNS